LIALDSSVVVAAFASWHQGHVSAAAALARRPRLPAHVAVESFSVLTRLPPPHRAPAGLVAAFLGSSFPGAPLTLPGSGNLELVRLAADAGLSGGAIYDALVGAIARHARATLLTRDRRALVAYEVVGARFELLD
jgi:hypothetical protein